METYGFNADRSVNKSVLQIADAGLSSSEKRDLLDLQNKALYTPEIFVSTISLPTPENFTITGPAPTFSIELGSRSDGIGQTLSILPYESSLLDSSDNRYHLIPIRTWHSYSSTTGKINLNLEMLLIGPSGPVSGSVVLGTWGWTAKRVWVKWNSREQ